MTHPVTQRAALKGWSAIDIAERWGITPRTYSRQAKASSQQFIDAIEGLPDYEAPRIPLGEIIKELPDTFTVGDIRRAIALNGDTHNGHS